MNRQSVPYIKVTGIVLTLGMIAGICRAQDVLVSPIDSLHIKIFKAFSPPDSLNTHAAYFFSIKVQTDRKGNITSMTGSDSMHPMFASSLDKLSVRLDKGAFKVLGKHPNTFLLPVFFLSNTNLLPASYDRPGTLKLWQFNGKEERKPGYLLAPYVSYFERGRKGVSN